jgi:predicted transcriptional regulator
MKRFNVHVDDSIHKRMKILAVHLDCGMSELIRTAVEEMVEKHEAEIEADKKAKTK